MVRVRLHNILMAIAIGAVLGVTAWSLHAREPDLIAPGGVIAPQPQKPTSQTKNTEPTNESRVPNPESRLTEQMIERGELSKHPARFYKKEP